MYNYKSGDNIELRIIYYIDGRKFDLWKKGIFLSYISCKEGYNCNVFLEYRKEIVKNIPLENIRKIDVFNIGGYAGGIIEMMIIFILQ